MESPPAPLVVDATVLCSLNREAVSRSDYKCKVKGEKSMTIWDFRWWLSWYVSVIIDEPFGGGGGGGF
jgi:hypothetical protein